MDDEKKLHSMVKAVLENLLQQLIVSAAFSKMGKKVCTDRLRS